MWRNYGSIHSATASPLTPRTKEARCGWGGALSSSSEEKQAFRSSTFGNFITVRLLNVKHEFHGSNLAKYVVRIGGAAVSVVLSRLCFPFQSPNHLLRLPTPSLVIKVHHHPAALAHHQARAYDSITYVNVCPRRRQDELELP